MKEERKVKEAAATSKGLNTTMDVQSPAYNSHQLTPQGHRTPLKINLDNYRMDLNSNDSTDDKFLEVHPLLGQRHSPAIIHQYYHSPTPSTSPNLIQVFVTIRQLDLEDIFKKSKPR